MAKLLKASENPNMGHANGMLHQRRAHEKPPAFRVFFFVMASKPRECQRFCLVLEPGNVKGLKVILSPKVRKTREMLKVFKVSPNLWRYAHSWGKPSTPLDILTPVL